MVPRLREDREADRLPGRVLEHAVAVAIGEAQARRAAFSPAPDRERILRRGVGVPGLVAGRDRAVDRDGGAEIHRVDDGVAIDGAERSRWRNSGPQQVRLGLLAGGDARA